MRVIVFSLLLRTPCSYGPDPIVPYTTLFRAADATAFVDAIELSGDPADLLALMQRHSRIALNMIAIVGRRLGEAQERLRELATQSADRRSTRLNSSH